jgi:CpeT protein
MRYMKKSIAALLMFAGACASAPPAPPAEIQSPTPAGQAYMSLLVRYLTGTFETMPQPAQMGDSTPLKLRQAPFWKDRKGEFWMYAEYARSEDDQHPYRQRIYRFTESGGRITAAIFGLPGDPAPFVGEWRKEAPFAAFDPSSLREREGCRVVFFSQMEIVFSGGRDSQTCHGEFPEADHEHAEFYVTSSSIRTLEDGRDAAGKHVSGPVGSSEFRKILQFPG